ncbi:MAG: hypothetical protein U5N56_00785 [Candidatus Marinimicrobia bacterium]|nr:hypothetical protein [Candidatus Neomarinimicrobiota bacterium]
MSNKNAIIIYDLRENLEVGYIDIELMKSCNILPADYHIKGKFNHVITSPYENEFIFLFRYYNSENIRKHLLLFYNINKKSLNKLIEGEVISHYNWLNKHEIILWGIMNNQKDYFMMNIRTKCIRSLNTKLTDGHPSVIDNNKIITDTYPMVNRYRNLIKFNIETRNSKVIAKLL